MINECGISDQILILNQAFVLFTGMAGRLGCTGMLDARFTNNFYSFGHSGYFQDGRQPSDTFMARRWLPLLVSCDTPDPVDQRTPTALQGLFTFLLQNAEPIKLAVYLSPFVVVATVFAILYIQTEKQRLDLLARNLVSQSALLTESGRTQMATLVALEAYRRFPTERQTDAVLAASEQLTVVPTLDLSVDGDIQSISADRGTLWVAMLAEARLFDLRTGNRLATLPLDAAKVKHIFTLLLADPALWRTRPSSGT